MKNEIINVKGVKKKFKNTQKCYNNTNIMFSKKFRESTRFMKVFKTK